MIRNKKAPARSSNKQVRLSAYEAKKQLDQQETHVNFVSAWLERRRHQNGFGEDFELTLRPRGAR
jgi:hypothetical protein